jgi:leader peptidase (prepilin peptidase)/N-methyltransferase
MDITGLLVFFIGAVLGSTFNCAVWRRSQGLDYVRGRSQCPHCGRRLAFTDMIPLVSWLALRGRCRYCRARIAPRDLLTEAAGGLSAVEVWNSFRYDGYSLAVAALFAATLFLLALEDGQSMSVPEDLLWAAALEAVLLEKALDTVALDSRVWGVLVVSLPLLLLGKVFRAFGTADAILAGIGGLALGAAGILQAFLLAVWAAAGYALILLAAGKKGLRSRLPFLPFFCAGLFVVLCRGPQIGHFLGF